MSIFHASFVAEQMDTYTSNNPLIRLPVPHARPQLNCHNRHKERGHR
jgi:hypothetical protein